MTAEFRRRLGLPGKTLIRMPFNHLGVITTSFVGELKVESTENGRSVRVTCQCGQTPPLVLSSTEWAMASPVCGAWRCAACARQRPSLSEDLENWVLTHKRRFRQDSCVHYPGELPTLVTNREGESERPRRFIYKLYYGWEPNPKTFIKMWCRTTGCLNPLHMHESKSCATKVSVSHKHEMMLWKQKGMTTRQIQQLMLRKHGINCSLRTIQRSVK